VFVDQTAIQDRIGRPHGLRGVFRSSIGLVENIMAGGDSASRGLTVGMVLGAHLGLDAIPSKWLSDLKAYQEIIDLMDQIDQKIDDK